MLARRTKKSACARGAATLLTATVFLGACRSGVPDRDPLGETFPAVEGESLAGDLVVLPTGDAATVVLVGYDQDAQFDADRWILGLAQAETPARILEVPAIVGTFPRLFGGKIDAGMRSGIPSEDWATVVTLYGEDAERIRDFTGNETPRNMRVFLLDAQGRVRWFHDRGYSTDRVLALDHEARALTESR